MGAFRYFVFAPEGEGTGALTAPVGECAARFLHRQGLHALKPVSMTLYVDGFSAILGSAARWSYVMHGSSVLWAVEWDPGLLLVRFNPDGALDAAAFRSPSPGFGGGVPLPEDLDFDEPVEDPLYSVVFDAWDAQFSKEDRDAAGFREATTAERGVWDTAIAPVEALAEEISARRSCEDWLSSALRRIEDWAGAGIRLTVTQR